MSGVSEASVSGMPSSSARLSAIASSRRIRPGDRVLGEHRLAELAQLLQGCLLVLQPQPAGLAQVVGDLVAEDLQGTVDASAGSHGGTGGAAQVGVVEVGQPVGGRPDLATHPPLLPGEQGLVGTEAGEQLADGVTVPDHDAVDAADLAGLGRDAEPTGRADEGQRRFRAGAGHLERAGATGLGEGAVGEEGAAPGSHCIAAGAVDDDGRKTTHRTVALVDQAGLAGE